MATSVLLADDHAILRVGVRALLEREGDLRVIGEAGDGRTAVQLARELQPDVVVMDIGMPELNGIEATRQISQELGCAVVALSMHGDRQFVSSMIRAGAVGYVLKEAAAVELVTAVRAAALGQRYLSAAVNDLVLDDYARRLDEGDEAVLSPREQEVLQLLAEGNSTRAIAERLHLSVKTVETHRSNLMGKLDLHSVAELTKYAIRRGYTSLEK